MKKSFTCILSICKKLSIETPRKLMEWAARKKGIPEKMVRAVASLYQGEKTKARAGTKFSNEFPVKVGVHQGSVLSPGLRSREVSDS